MPSFLDAAIDFKKLKAMPSICFYLARARGYGPYYSDFFITDANNSTFPGSIPTFGISILLLFIPPFHYSYAVRGTKIYGTPFTYVNYVYFVPGGARVRVREVGTVRKQIRLVSYCRYAPYRIRMAPCAEIFGQNGTDCEDSLLIGHPELESSRLNTIF